MIEAHLNDTVLSGSRVQSILDIALSNHSKMSDDIDRRRPQHVIVDVRERLRRSNDDRVSSVNTQRIKVLKTWL